MKRNYTVSGPITGGIHGWPRLAYMGDISNVGYVEEEYFIEGEAVSYNTEGALSLDGNWTLTEADAVPYKTRFIVHRPADPGKFNGSVIVEWLNVSLGYETTVGHANGTYEDGFAIVFASVQERGIHCPDYGMIKWDPERYSSLHIANDWISYDIFTQIARAVGPDRDKSGVDPMGGLTVKRLIANGYSHSGCSIISYANGIQPIEHTFDAFVPTVSGLFTVFDDASNKALLARVTKGSAPDASAQDRRLMSTGCHIREDLDAVVFYINTEAEVKITKLTGQPNTDKVRVWNVAGAPHLSRGPRYNDKYMCLRDGIVHPEYIDSYVEVCYLPTMDAVLRHVNRWIDEQILPPVFPPIESDENGKIIRDEFGNAKGGVRLPELEVPIATYVGEMGFTKQKPRSDMGVGITVPCYGGTQYNFTTEQLKKLYKDNDDYTAKIRAAAEKARDQGIITASRVEEYVEDAQMRPVPAANVIYI